MSLNIHLIAKIDAVSYLGNHTIKHRFKCWQTPTTKTVEILNSDNKAEAYKSHIMVFSEDEKFPIYSDDDPFELLEPIDYEIVNYAKEHIHELDSFLEEHAGWEIEWYGA